MGYVILWLASLAAALLLVATVVTLAARLERRRYQIDLAVLAALPTFAVGVLVSIACGIMWGRGFRPSWFAYCLSWTVLLAVGATLVAVFGLWRRGDSEAPPRARSWSWRKLGTGIPAAAACYLGTLLFMDAMARLKLMDLRCEAAALAAMTAPARVPDRENAAPLYRRASEALGDLWKDPQAPGYPWDDPTDDVSGAEVEEFLRERGTIREVLHRAAGMPGFYEEASHTLLVERRMPDLVGTRNCANLLALSARNNASQGRMKDALADIAAIWSMASHVGAQPGIMECMIADAIDAVGSKAVEHVLAAAEPSRDEVKEFCRRPQLSFRDAYLRACLADEAMGLWVFANCGKIDDHLGGWNMDMSPTAAVIWRVHILPSDLDSYRDWCSSRRFAARKPYPFSMNAAKQADTRFKDGKGGILSFMMISELGPAIRAVAGCDAFHRLALLGLAAASFRSETGTYPQNLAQLAPGYIPAVPIDPFDGKPLKMVAEGDGLVLYSVGEDRDDDGGDDGLVLCGGSDVPDGDVVFCLGNAYRERRLKPAQEAAARRKARISRRRSRK